MKNIFVSILTLLSLCPQEELLGQANGGNVTQPTVGGTVRRVHKFNTSVTKHELAT